MYVIRKFCFKTIWDIIITFIYIYIYILGPCWFSKSKYLFFFNFILLLFIQICIPFFLPLFYVNIPDQNYINIQNNIKGGEVQLLWIDENTNERLNMTKLRLPVSSTTTSQSA